MNFYLDLLRPPSLSLQMIDESEQREGWRAEIFQRKVKEEQPDGRPRPVIPWQRIKEFKLVTLKMIVGCMLHHQSRKQIKPERATLSPPPRLQYSAAWRSQRSMAVLHSPPWQLASTLWESNFLKLLGGI